MSDEITALDDRIDDLRAKQTALTAASSEMRAALDADGKEWSQDDLARFDANSEAFAKLQGEIDRRQAILNMETAQRKGLGRKTDPDPPQPQMHGGEQLEPGQRRRLPAVPVDTVTRGRGGYRSFGEFALSVRAGCDKVPHIDPRLEALMLTATTAAGNTGTGAEGGFLVPEDFRQTILTKVFAEETLVSRTDQQTTSSNSYTQPLDEVTPWDGTNGPQAFWVGENAQITQSAPDLRKFRIELEKLTALVPVTDEQLADGPGLTGYLNSKVPAKFTAKVNTAIVAGTGAGQPQGLLSSPDIISVAKETIPAAQAADTVLAENINKMWNRLYAPWRADAIWIANQDIEPQLDLLFFGILNAAKSDYVGGQPIYLPGGTIASQPFSSLKNRPVIFNQAAKTLGDQGDLILWSPSQYITVTRSGGGVRTDTSIHMFFDWDVTAFRFIFRFGGRPQWAAVIDPENGTTTYSSTVVLDERA